MCRGHFTLFITAEGVQLFSLPEVERKEDFLHACLCKWQSERHDLFYQFKLLSKTLLETGTAVSCPEISK